MKNDQGLNLEGNELGALESDFRLSQPEQQEAAIDDVINPMEAAAFYQGSFQADTFQLEEDRERFGQFNYSGEY